MEKNLRNESTTQIITYFVQNINRKNPKNYKSKFKSRLKSPSSEKGNIICLNELNIVS